MQTLEAFQPVNRTARRKRCRTSFRLYHDLQDAIASAPSRLIVPIVTNLASKSDTPTARVSRKPRAEIKRDMAKGVTII